MANILQEFLVAIGFDVNENQYRDTESKLNATTQQFAKLGKIALEASGAILAVGYTLGETTSKMEGLYFAAQRAGTSVASLMAIRFGGEQAGVSAEAMTSAVERLGASFRSNSGMVGFFNMLTGGAYQKENNAANFDALIAKLKQVQDTQGTMAARMMGSIFGFDEGMLTNLLDNNTDFQKGQEQFASMLKEAGIDAGTLSERSHEAMENWRTFNAEVEILKMLFEQHMLPFIDKFLSGIIWITKEMVALDKATGGWSTGISIAVIALMSVAAVLGTIGTILGAISSTGIVAGLIGLLGAIGLPELLAIAGIGGAGYLAYKYFKGKGENSGSGSEADRIAGAEGFRNQVYNDSAGNPTIGYGHKILPGEDYSGGISEAAARQLLMKDVAAAHDAVMSMVKVPLNDNQVDALTDFAFNLGPGALGKSTLLRMLNSGDYTGAADQFARWNKAGGRSLSGLTTRRLGERDLFSSGGATMEQNTTIHVYGNDDPKATGAAVASHQRQVNGDLLRNMAPKVV